MFALLGEVPGAAPALVAAHDVVTTTTRHAPLHADVDLALAVLTVSSGMPASAGKTIFAVARTSGIFAVAPTSGWIAHTLEEYAERPLRTRPSGHER